jgi:DNA-binding SARP family transcriptional activator
VRHQFHLRLLEGFRLDQGGQDIPTPMAACRLIAFLGIRGRCSRTEIVGNLWPEVSEPKAHASLRTVLWRLRQMTDAPLVAGGGQVLSLSPRVEVDVARFVSIARQLLATPSTGKPPTPTDRAPVSVGELLPGWYDDWVLFERERLRQLQMHALEAVSLRLIAEGRHADAIEAALAAVRLEPLRESATRVLIMVHLAEHNIVEAVRRFQVFRDLLRQELGVTPSAELERMVFRSRPR